LIIKNNYFKDNFIINKMDISEEDKKLIKEKFEKLKNSNFK
jgi:hypothetical protein